MVVSGCLLGDDAGERRGRLALGLREMKETNGGEDWRVRKRTGKGKIWADGCYGQKRGTFHGEEMEDIVQVTDGDNGSLRLTESRG